MLASRMSLSTGRESTIITTDDGVIAYSHKAERIVKIYSANIKAIELFRKDFTKEEIDFIKSKNPHVKITLVQSTPEPVQEAEVVPFPEDHQSDASTEAPKPKRGRPFKTQ